eukprot:gene20320-22319_t
MFGYRGLNSQKYLRDVEDWRVCTLRIIKLEVSKNLEQDLTELVISVSMSGSRRNLRSDSVPLPQTTPIDVELDFSFSLQYPHFLKRRGNFLRVMLQRKKKYKGRPMLGYKTLAVGQIDMAQVLQGYSPNNLHLHAKGVKAPAATITLASLSSQSIDQEVPGTRAGQDNLSSTDEEIDDDLSGSDYSGGELEDPGRQLADFDPQRIMPRKTSKNLKKKFIDAIFGKLKANPEDYGDIPDELYVDPNEPDVDDNQIFIYDEDEDSETDEMFADSFSIKSTQRPKLRPYFDQLSRNESSLTLTHDKVENPDKILSPRQIKETESGEESKELSPSSDSDHQKDAQSRELATLQPKSLTVDKAASPSRLISHRSVSFKERRDIDDRLERHHLKRKSSVDFDSSPQLSVQPLADQMLTALSADDIIPEKLFLISIRDSSGQILAMKMMNRLERLICTTCDSDVQSVMATIASKLQKYCNKHSASPPPMRICIIGHESYLGAVLRSYVDQFSLKSPEFQGYVRFLIVPSGNSRLASYLASQDSKYQSLFMDQLWRNNFEQMSKSDEDFAEIERRILLYTKSASVLLSVPVAEALITYKCNKSTEGESSQLFIPFVTDVRVSGQGSDIDLDEYVSIASRDASRDVPSTASANSNSANALSSSPNSRDSSLDKNVQPTVVSSPWAGSMQNETFDLQLDYWPVVSSAQNNKREEKKEPNKLSIKTTFRSLVVTRLPHSECDEANSLFLSAQTKARNKGVMRLKKTKDKDTESKSMLTAFVNKIVCTSKSHSQTFNVTVDGSDLCGIKFFALSSQWPTHVKNFPIGIFGPTATV